MISSYSSSGSLSTDSKNSFSISRFLSSPNNSLKIKSTFGNRYFLSLLIKCLPFTNSIAYANKKFHINFYVHTPDLNKKQNVGITKTIIIHRKSTGLLRVKLLLSYITPQTLINSDFFRKTEKFLDNTNRTGFISEHPGAARVSPPRGKSSTYSSRPATVS